MEFLNLLDPESKLDEDSANFFFLVVAEVGAVGLKKKVLNS